MSCCSDPVGDVLARLRNGCVVGKDSVSIPFSSLKRKVLDVFLREGFVRDVEEVETPGSSFKSLKVSLSYTSGRSAIKEMRRISKPSCRRYSGIKSLRPLYNGLGTLVLSTSRGILSDREARLKNVGGEVLCYVF